MRYKIPVSWTMTAIYEVEADSLADAVEAAEEETNLPRDGEYLDGSFEISQSVYADYPE